MTEAIISVFLVYFLYYIATISKYDRAGNLKKSIKELKNDKKTINDLEIDSYNGLPSEVKYFVRRYKIDLNMLNKKGLLKLIGAVLSIDVSLIILIMSLFIDSLIIQMITTSILIIPVYLMSLKILGKFFKKKGWVKKDEKPKRNRK